MKKQPFCSIIVLNFNGKRHLNDCFKSLRKINYPKNRYEVIMVDNASTDGSIKFVKKHFSWVRILSLRKNYGFSEGNNKGATKAKGEYIIFLNNDTEVEKDWLIELVKVANDKKIGICGPKIIDKTLGEIGEGHMIFGMEYQRSGNKLKECFWVSGCSMFVKREVIEKMGRLFDPSYFMYYEDVDACWRARRLGYKVMYVPTSIVHHTGRLPTEDTAFFHYRNKIWTFKKNTKFPLTQLYMIPIGIVVILKCPLKYKIDIFRQIIRSDYTNRARDKISYYVRNSKDSKNNLN